MDLNNKSRQIKIKRMFLENNKIRVKAKLSKVKDIQNHFKILLKKQKLAKRHKIKEIKLENSLMGKI